MGILFNELIMRQIIIDTETTGLLTSDNHRIIEIGCVELIDRQFTKNTFHHYLNPQRAVEAEALEVHGITNTFLADKPLFSDILPALIEFITGAELIAHNAEFDVGFINHEIKLVDKSHPKLNKFVKVIDTLLLARKMFPGQKNSLDALCRRYKINLSARKYHGALLDAQLLAEVYLLMTGGQTNLFAAWEELQTQAPTNSIATQINTTRKPLPIIAANPEELAAHDLFLTRIQKSSNNCLWKQE